MNSPTYLQHLGTISWHLELIISQTNKEQKLIQEIQAQVQQLIGTAQENKKGNNE